MANGSWGGTGDTQPLQVKISWTAGTNVQQTGFHLRAAALTLSDAQEAADQVATWVTNSLRPLLRQDQRIQGIDVVNMTTRDGAAVSPANQFGALGNPGPTFSPSFLAAVVSLKSAKRTRYGQGRMFLPVTYEEFHGGDQLNNTGPAAFQGAVTALLDAFTGHTVSGYNLCNVHGLLAPRPATTSRPARPEIQPAWYDVITARLNTNITFLRSRKAGTGS